MAFCKENSTRYLSYLVNLVQTLLYFLFDFRREKERQERERRDRERQERERRDRERREREREEKALR